MADYGFHLLGTIVAEKEQCLSSDALAKKSNLPRATVRKLLGLLKAAQLIEAKSGKYGGYVLHHDYLSKNMMDVIEAIDGPITLTQCCDDDHNCHLIQACQHQNIFFEINQQIHSTLSAISVAALVSKPKTQGFLLKDIKVRAKHD